jgi:hypothetical protein
MKVQTYAWGPLGMRESDTAPTLQIEQGLALLERAPKEKWRYEPSDWCCLCPDEPHTKLNECPDREVYAPASIGGSAFCIDLGDYHGLSDESAELIVYLKNNAPALLAAAKRTQELEAQNRALRECLRQIRNDAKLWRSSAAGGQDQYAGLPPAMRLIDDALAAQGEQDE